MDKSKLNLRKLVYAALCLALCLVLPFLTGQIPQFGKLMCPMHLPVLLCGIICSWYYGAAIGFLAPLLRYFMFGMPIFVSAVPMAFELAAYGACAGILYMLLPKKLPYIYLSLVGAMLFGRVIWALAMLVCILIGFSNRELTFTVFVTTEFVETWVGVVLQLLIIPPVVFGMRRARLIAE